jgi:hypothetical protein
LGSRRRLILGVEGRPVPRQRRRSRRCSSMLRQAHSLWHEELNQYAAQRLAAKRAGQRAPRPSDTNPNVLRTWQRREKEAALFAVRRWRISLVTVVWPTNASARSRDLPIVPSQLLSHLTTRHRWRPCSASSTHLPHGSHTKQTASSASGIELSPSLLTSFGSLPALPNDSQVHVLLQTR